MFANSKEDRKEYLNLLKGLKLSGIRSKKIYKEFLKNLKSRYRKKLEPRKKCVRKIKYDTLRYSL